MVLGKKMDHYLAPYTKINLKWINDLNIKPETIKLLEGNTEIKLLDISFGNYFFGFDTNSQDNKAINKLDYIKLKSCTAKEAINKMKRQPAE